MSSGPSKSKSKNAGGSSGNERSVTDPITHLPVKIHDRNSVELEQIPPPSYVEDQAEDQEHDTEEGEEDKQASQAQTQKRHNDMDGVVDEEVHKGWWDDPESEKRRRTQAALLAASAAGTGGSISLILSRLMNAALGTRGGLVWTDLLIGSVGSLVLALGVGGAVFYYGQSMEEKKEAKDSKKKDKSKDKEWSKNPVQKHPETALWLNSFLDSLWPIVNPSLFTSLADMLEDILQSSLPKFIHGVRVADIGQGSEPVRILGVRWLDGGEAARERDGMEAEEGDFVNFELAVAYRARHSKSAGLKGRSANMHLLMQFYLTSGVVLPVWVELTGLLATLRVRIRLTPNPPFMSLMTVTFMGQPKVVINATPLAKSFLNVMDIPGLSGWIQSTVDAAVQGYVAPRSLTMDLKTMLMGREKMDTEAMGVIVVTVKSAEGYRNGDSSKVWQSTEGRAGDPYVAVGWGKWGKPIWSTRIIQNEHQPVWEETGFMLVTLAELNAEEQLKLQLWDSDRFTADDNLGTVEVPLKDVMRSYENKFSERKDELVGDDGKKWPGTLSWSIGYFSKTTLEQHMSDKPDFDADQVVKEIEEEAEEKLREAQTRKTNENKEIEEQKKEDLKEKMDEMIAESPAPREWPSGILSVRIMQIDGLEVPNVTRKAAEKSESGVEEESSNEMPSAYCTVIINHEMVYKTRTKMKANNPYYDAGTEKFIKDWTHSMVIIAVRDQRQHEKDPLIGVIVLPLQRILKKRSQLTDSYPLVGGLGFGRLKFSLMFRPLQADIPRPLLGWEVGTIEIYPESVKGSDGFPQELKGCRILLRTLFGRGKVYPHQESSGGGGGWRSKRDKPVRLAVKKRFSSCLLIQFRKRVLGPDQTPAFGTFWLRDIPDSEEQTVRVVVRRNKGNAMERSRFNTTHEIGEKVGEMEMKVKFWPGLSGYHQRMMKKDAGLGDVMDALDAAEGSLEEQGDERLVDEGYDDESSSSSSSSSSESENEEEELAQDGDKGGIGGRLKGIKTGIKEYSNRKDELHRKHRGLMQWSMARKVAWIGQEAEGKAHEITSEVKGKFKHQQRDGAVEKEA